jgi:pimeloyl-ACP methyl ester carboxylesterase
MAKPMLDLPNRFSHEGNSVAWGAMGSGPPLVLVHGTPFSSQVWRRIAPLLARRWTVYYFDLIGYGQSEMRGVQDVSLAVQNGLLAALLRTWSIAGPEVLCHDFGGATALRAYYLDGLRYKRLTLIDPVAVAPWGSPFVAHVRRYESAFTGLPAYAHDALLRAYLQTAAHAPLSDEAFHTYMTPWQGAEGQAGFYRQIAQMDQKFTDEIEHRYAPLDCPVTLLWGEQDQWIPIARGHALAAKLTQGNLIPVPGSGHLMQEDAPEAIIAAMFNPPQPIGT